MICVNSVSVYPKSISLKVGTWSYAAYAEVCPSDADCKEVQWHSDNSSVASVNAASGYIYANSVGTAHIYATATDGSGCSDYLTVTVSNSVPVTSITLNRSSISLEEGHSVSLFATVCPDNATNKNVNWTSSNNSVATVSNGIVTAVAKGSAKITATAADGSGKSSFCVVTVTGDVLVTSITVSPKSQTLSIGDSMFLGVIVCPSDATKKSVCWSSCNTNIATVNELTGLVIAQHVGNVTIYATACDGSGIVGCCSVKVNAPIMVECISVCPETLTMNVGETAALSANVFPTNAKNKTIRWTPCDCNIADVDYVTGCVTAKAEGTTYICAHAVDGSCAYGCCAVIVRTVPVSQIEVIPNTLTVNIGEKYYLNKTVSPNNATNQSVTWTSSNTSVATVSDEGEIIGIGEGNAIITAASQDNGEIYSTCNVTVKIPLTAISVSPTSATINKDDTISLSAIISPSNATNKDVTWTSSNTSVATIDALGNVRGNDFGTAIITATSVEKSSVQEKCIITVVPNGNNANISFFSSMLNELLTYANEYAPNKSASDKQLLVLQYIRRIPYKSSLWEEATGYIDSAFVNYVNSKNPNMNTIFNGNENSFGKYLYDTEGNKIDFYHLIATLNSLLYNTSPLFNIFISETEINDMCGWAGDLQQLIKNNVFPVSSDENIYEKTYSRLGNDSYAFSMSDLRSDIDAINIYNNGTNSATVINNLIAYYSGNSCTQRYSLSKSKFGNSNSATHSIVRPYTRKTTYPWVTNGLTISEIQANDMAQAFCDFLWELIDSEG